MLTDLSKWQNCTPGSKVQATGKVNKGRDRIQLDIEQSEDFQVLEKGTSNPLEKPSFSDQAVQDLDPVEKK